MWARHAEIFVGIWLAISWLIFHYSSTPLLVNDFICAFLICLFSLGSYSKKLSHLHLLNFIMGLWLIGFIFTGYVHFAASQNYMVVALLLLMLALVPSRTEEPPQSWIDFMEKRKNKK